MKMLSENLNYVRQFHTPDEARSYGVLISATTRLLILSTIRRIKRQASYAFVQRSRGHPAQDSADATRAWWWSKIDGLSDSDVLRRLNRRRRAKGFAPLKTPRTDWELHQTVSRPVQAGQGLYDALRARTTTFQTRWRMMRWIPEGRPAAMERTPEGQPIQSGLHKTGQEWYREGLHHALSKLPITAQPGRQPTPVSDDIIRLAQAQMRVCLGPNCGQLFRSAGRWNRLCDRCQQRVDRYSRGRIDGGTASF